MSVNCGNKIEFSFGTNNAGFCQDSYILSILSVNSCFLSLTKVTILVVNNRILSTLNSNYYLDLACFVHYSVSVCIWE